MATQAQSVSKPRVPTQNWQRRISNALPAIILFFVILFAWEFLVRLFDIQAFLLPAPSAIIQAFGANTEQLQSAAELALYEAFGGLLIGSFIAITAGLIAVRFDIARRALIPFAIGFNAVPVLVFAPIMNNWFGSISPLSNMMVVVTLIYYPIMINVVRGLTQVDPERLELMQSYGASEWEIFSRLRFFNGLPYLFNALKLSATLSVIGTVVAGYFGGPRTALGVWILNEVVLFRFPSAWAGIIIACSIGIFFYVIISIIERFAMPWHESIRGNAE